MNYMDQDIKILGLMTGSSADGLDLCLVQFRGAGRLPQFEVLGSHEIPFPLSFQKSFRNPLQLTNDQIAGLDIALGQWFSHEIEKLSLDFDIIASHGQTIRHEPPFFSQQIGSPHAISEKFRCPVVYDFRNADIRQGGQGAPLIPIVDQFLLQHDTLDILSLNIGGIANISIIPGTANPAPVLAWDTGPGNTLIDKAVRAFTRDRQAYDFNGQLAAQGRANLKLLEILLKHEFYDRTPPRSAGQEQFGDSYFNNLLQQFYPVNDSEFKDLIHTFTLLTAKTISQSIKALSADYRLSSMFVAGGGTQNKTLMKLLRAELPTLKINAIDVKGVNPSNKEAFGFAYLGYLFVNNFTANIPSVTGAQKAVRLGKLCEPRLI
jgi:anhydro-N-acetylmuramic acid kinase